jgi:hypothetical protein
VANDGIQRELQQISMKSSPVLRDVLRLRLAGLAGGDSAGRTASERA